MILSKLLSIQVLKLIKEFKKYHQEIFDVAIYGSAVRDKTDLRDVDFAIIFLQPETLEKKLNLSQELKNKLKNKFDFEIDVKCVDIKDLLDSSFLARTAIVAESFLITRKKFLHDILGFKSYFIFSYSLKNLNQSKKVMFQYALQGRRGEKGLLEITNSISLGRGVIKVPLQHAEEIKEFLEKNKIECKIYKVLCY